MAIRSVRNAVDLNRVLRLEQFIRTRDMVSLRLNLSAIWRYKDVLKACTQLAKPAEHLYRELQFGLRAAVGTHSLDDLLENKTVIDDVVTAHVVSKLAAYGGALDGVGVKDIVLPGEMKTILAQVVEAEKSAQANVIRRRDETAATRSLLNTAKVMAGNPVALRMKELETLERVAERIDKISVLGGLDQEPLRLVTGPLFCASQDLHSGISVFFDRQESSFSAAPAPRARSPPPISGSVRSW